jgi:hypothetical protein
MDDDDSFISFNLICPECGVGNPEGSKYCLVCDRNLEDTLLFLEDDSFDLEVTADYLIEYRKNFWGTRRTGKVVKFSWDKIEDVQFGSPVNRFIFFYDGRRVVLPLREENMQMMKRLFKEYELQLY